MILVLIDLDFQGQIELPPLPENGPTNEHEHALVESHNGQTGQIIGRCKSITGYSPTKLDLV